MTVLIECANADRQFLSQGRESGLTTTLSLFLEDGEVCWTVHFVDGRITRFESEDDGEFAIRGKKEWWQAVFDNRIDPFLATQQGKLRLSRGELWKLSQWFKPFQRAFQLWQRIPIR
jgi:putative sterol carrier protein